jgi:DNA-binding response OmpR family regulator
MLTARDDLDALAEGMQLGVSDFIAKPLIRRQLADRINAQPEMLAASRVNLATLRQFDGRNPTGNRTRGKLLAKAYPVRKCPLRCPPVVCDEGDVNLSPL